MSILVGVAQVGSGIFLCGLVIFAVGGPKRRKVLLGWTEKVGWGVLGFSWVNKLGVALIVIGILGPTVTFPGAIIYGLVGFAIMALGVLAQFAGGGKQ